MLKSGWLIVHLIAGAMATPQAGTGGEASGVSCTYQACMAKCGGLNGEICHSYCEAKVRQRLATGICRSEDAAAVQADELDRETSAVWK